MSIVKSGRTTSPAKPRVPVVPQPQPQASTPPPVPASPDSAQPVNGRLYPK